MADWPALTVAELEEPEGRVRVKSSPVPRRATVCGLSAALSAMLKVPVSAPPAVGLKVTEIEQLAPAARVVPRVMDGEKSPLALMLEMLSVTVPVLVRVTLCTELAVPDICAANVSVVARICFSTIRGSWSE